MHQTSDRAHHHPDHSTYNTAGFDPSIARNTIGTNRFSTYPNVSSIGPNMNCETEVNELSEELRTAVEECQVERFTNVLSKC